MNKLKVSSFRGAENPAPRKHFLVLAVAVPIAVAAVALATPALVSAFQNVFISSSQVGDIMVGGTTPVTKVYVGSNLVWERWDGTIQKATTANCPTSRTGVRDSRDGHYYAVQKLADGRCWMLTNLAYGGTEAGVKFTGGAGQSTTTNVGASSVNWNQRNPPYNNQKQFLDPSATAVTLDSVTRCATSYRTSAATINYTECGYLYNFCAALGNANGQCGTGASLVIPNAGEGVCPVGWKLPSDAEFTALYSATGSVSNFLTAFRVATAYAGLFGGGVGIVNSAAGGYYHSSSNLSTTQTRATVINNTTVLTARELDKMYGAAIRCIAK